MENFHMKYPGLARKTLITLQSHINPEPDDNSKLWQFANHAAKNLVRYKMQSEGGAFQKQGQNPKPKSDWDATQSQHFKMIWTVKI